MKNIAFLFCLFMLPIAVMGQITLEKELSKRGHEVICSAYSTDGKYLATGGTDNYIYVWNLATGTTTQRMHTRKWPRTLCFTPDGKGLISGGKDQRLKYWNLQTGELLYSRRGHRGQIVSIAIDPVNSRIASGGADGKIIIWDLTTGKAIKDLRGHRDNVNAVSFHPSGTKLASGSADKNIIEWNIQSGLPIRKFRAHSSWIRAIDYSPDGSLLASAGDDKRIKIWQDGIEINEFIAHRDWIQTLAFSPDGAFLITGSHDKHVILWELKSGKILFNKKLDNKVADVLFNPTGKEMVAVDFTSTVRIWDTQSLNITPTTYSLVIPIADKSHKDLAENKIPVKQKTQEKPITIPEKINNAIVIPIKNSLEKDTNKEPEKKEEPKTTVPQKISPTPLPQVIDVDKLPTQLAPQNENRYALIIGNEDYSNFQLNLKKESNVDYAVHDATIFKEYARGVLGIPTENIIFMTNARAIEMHRAINKLNMIAGITQGKAEIYFYYAGHGFPDEKTKEPYIMPVDVSGSDLEFALSLNEVYEKLTEHPTRHVTVLLDACFSGGARNQGLIAARGVKIQPKQNILRGNLVVFAASSGNQSSLPYHNKKHGMFTYYLLKKLQESSGKISYKEMSDYLYEQVGVKSVLINNTKQTPETNTSVDMKTTWGNLQWHP